MLMWNVISGDGVGDGDISGCKSDIWWWGLPQIVMVMVKVTVPVVGVGSVAIKCNIIWDRKVVVVILVVSYLRYYWGL